MGRAAKPTVYKRKDSPYWVLAYQNNRGERCRKTSGATTKRAALEELDRELQKDREAAISKLPIDRGILLFFQSKIDLKPSSQTRYQTSYTLWKTFFKKAGIVDFSQVTKGTVTEFIAWRRAMVVPVRPKASVQSPTIRRDIAFLSSVWHFLLDHPEWEEEMPRYPVTKLTLKQVPSSKKRVRWASGDEWSALIASTTRATQKEILEVAYETGMREGEMKNLVWPCIDLLRRQIRLLPELVEIKDNDARIIPMTERCYQIFRGMKCHKTSPHVFWHGDGQSYQRFAGFWKGARRRAKVRNLTFHDIRHTFACNFLNQTRDIASLSRILGHSSVEVTERYAFVLTETLHIRMKEMDDTQVSTSS